MTAFWNMVQIVSGIVTIVGVPYLVYQARKRRPLLKFDSAGQHGHPYEDESGRLRGVLTFRGTLINPSLETNTVSRIYLVVWRTKAKKATRRLGYGGVSVTDPDGEIGPPIPFPARSARDVVVRCDFGVSGTADEQLFTATRSVSAEAPHLQIPRYKYELAFQDVDGNLLDEEGLPRSLRAIGLRWTMDNAWERAKDGKPLALLKHWMVILREDTRFSVKRLFRAMGL